MILQSSLWIFPTLCCLYLPKVQKKKAVPSQTLLVYMQYVCIGTVEHCSKVIPPNVCFIAYRFVNRKQRKHSSCRLFRFSQRYAKNSNFQNQWFPTPRQMVIRYCSMFQCFNNDFWMNKANHSMFPCAWAKRS